MCFKAHLAGQPTLLGHFKFHGKNHGAVAACRLCESDTKACCPLSSIHKWTFNITPAGTFRLFEKQTPNPKDPGRLLGESAIQI